MSDGGIEISESFRTFGETEESHFTNNVGACLIFDFGGVADNTVIIIKDISIQYYE